MSRRLRQLSALALVACAAAAGSFYWYLEAQTVGTRCGSDQPAGTAGYRHEWNWWPFAYVCVYRDRDGRETVRRYPERPRIDDLR